MLVIIGSVIVMVSVLGGFAMAGGNALILLQWSEFVVILGSAFGAMVTMAPMKVHKDLIAQILGCLKGSRYNKTAYEDMFKALYEMFMLGRRNGMVALEPHIGEPATSSILTKYVGFSGDHHAIELLTGALRPLIDGKVKPDQIGMLMETEISAMEQEHHKPVEVLSKLPTRCPGSGSWLRCWASSSPWVPSMDRSRKLVTTWRQRSSAPSWGFWSPTDSSALTAAMHFNGSAEIGYYRTLTKAVSGFATGMAPMMALEVARRGLPGDVKPTAEELETMLKTASK